MSLNVRVRCFWLNPSAAGVPLLWLEGLCRGSVAPLPSGDALWDTVGLGAFPVQPSGAGDGDGHDGHGSPVRDPRRGQRCCWAVGGRRDRGAAGGRCPAAGRGQVSPGPWAALEGARAQGKKTFNIALHLFLRSFSALHHLVSKAHKPIQSITLEIFFFFPL